MKSTKSKLFIVGAGGHGKVAADCALNLDQWEEVSFIDDNLSHGEHVLGLPVVGRVEELASHLHNNSVGVFIAIGNAESRRNVFEQIHEFKDRLVTLIHPSATIARSAIIGPGTLVCASAVVNPLARVGMLSIINTSASVDHDCEVGELVHICPGAHVGGGVKVGDMSWIGIGASVMHGISIGRHVMVGAGASVIRDVPDNLRVVGVPARKIGETG